MAAVGDAITDDVTGNAGVITAVRGWTNSAQVVIATMNLSDGSDTVVDATGNVADGLVFVVPATGAGAAFRKDRN